MITLILMVAACICLFMQAFQYNVKKVEIGWLGLFFWCLAITIPLLIGSASITSQTLIILLVVLLVIILFIVLRRRTYL